MRFLPAAKEMTWRELREEVEVIINNLHWEHLTMNHEKFGSEGLELARQLDENIKIFQSDDFCYGHDEDYKPKHVRWLFDFFTKARSYGALTGVLHDETYEDRIKKLEARAESLQADNERLRNDNLILATELHDRQNISIPTSGVQYIREAIMTVRKDDISRCPSCGLQVIAEEIPTHQCRHRVIDYKIEGNILWLYDGVNWYPRKLLSISRSLNNTHFSTPKHDTPEDDRAIIIIITTYLFN